MGSPARRQIVGYYVEHAGSDVWQKENLEHAPREFLRDLAGKLVDGRVTKTVHGEVQTKLAAAEQNSKKLDSDLSKAKRYSEQKQARIDSLERSNARTENDNKRMAERVRMLQTRSNDHTSRIAKLDEEKKTLVARVQQPQTEQNTSAKRIKKLEGARESDKLKIVKLEAELKGIKAAIGRRWF